MPRKTPGNYVPLDVNYIRDASIRRAGEPAELLYVRALAHAKGARTAGFIPDYDLDVVAVGMKGVPARVAALVRERLWVVSPGGWLVRSWDRWNASGIGYFSELPHRRHISPALRTAVYDRDGWACVTCAATQDLTLDHIYPYSVGGLDTKENLQTMCRPCNARKGVRIA